MIITLKLFREGSTVATCRTRSEICQVAELYSWRICAFGCSNMLCGSISISRFGCTKPPRTIYDCSCLHLPTVFGFVIRFYRTKQFTVNSSICCSWQFSDRWTGGTPFEAVQVPVAATVQFSYPVSICWSWSRVWTFELCCWNVIWYSSELQCYRVLADSHGWIFTSVQDRHWSDFSPRVTGVCWPPVQHMWRPDGGQMKHNGKKNLELCVFLRMNLKYSTVDNVNPVNGRRVFDFSSWFWQWQIWFWAHDDDNDDHNNHE